MGNGKSWRSIFLYSEETYAKVFSKQLGRGDSGEKGGRGMGNFPFFSNPLLQLFPFRCREPSSLVSSYLCIVDPSKATNHWELKKLKQLLSSSIKHFLVS